MREFVAEIGGLQLHMQAEESLFSPEGLDAGTRCMLEAAELSAPLLDLGCGSGIVGIYAAKVLGEAEIYLCDISEQAVGCARRNAAENGVDGVQCLCSDGLDALPPEIKFACILSNPPYHADFAVPKKFIAQSFRRLKVGGRLYMVTKRRDWYENRLKAVFGGVRVREQAGYFVFEAQKRSELPPRKQKQAPALSKKLQKKYAGRKK